MHLLVPSHVKSSLQARVHVITQQGKQQLMALPNTFLHKYFHFFPELALLALAIAIWVLSSLDGR